MRSYVVKFGKLLRSDRNHNDHYHSLIKYGKIKHGEIVSMLKIAGFYAVSVIGAGFASGQEILRFFSSLYPVMKSRRSAAAGGVLGGAALFAACLVMYWAIRLHKPADVPHAFPLSGCSRVAAIGLGSCMTYCCAPPC